jgi:hypothetical protein
MDAAIFRYVVGTCRDYSDLIKYCIKGTNFRLDAILYQEPNMTSDPNAPERLSSLFSQKPCWKIEPLALEMKYSIPSVRRFLSEIGYYSSFTHNGSWYTLRSIPRFDQDGLWFHRDVGFSRMGSLTKTLVGLTVRSAAGLTAEQVGARLRCRCHSILLHLCRQGKLQRCKVGRSHVYLAAEEAVARVQRQTVESAFVAQLPAEIAVLILVEYIKNPELGSEQLAEALLRSRGVSVKAERIEGLFEQHGLKKTT